MGVCTCKRVVKLLVPGSEKMMICKRIFFLAVFCCFLSLLYVGSTYNKSGKMKILAETLGHNYLGVATVKERVRSSILSKIDISFKEKISSLIDIPSNFGFHHTQRHLRFTILWYNPAGWIKKRNKNLQMESCEFNNCHFTEDKAYLHNASALIFGISSENIGKHPPISSEKRNPDQVWIHHSREAPVYHIFFRQYKNPAWRNVMNWSMNFNFDADVFSPYGTIVTRQNFQSKNYDEIYDRKTNTALWLASYCDSKSKRSEFVKAMQKAGMQVDVFGKCGKGSYKGDIKKLIGSYKFYLSLENSFCKYYVTEKVFDRFNDDVILVIRGGANYEQLLPSGTFIDANKISNVSNLVRHLLDLGSDRKRYIDILKKKDKYYTLNEDTFGHQYSLCDICRKLNTSNGKRKSYNDLPNEVYKEGRCTNPEDILIN